MTRTTTPPQHGERRCYIAGCRLPECREANAAGCKRYRAARYREGALRVDAAALAEVVRRYAAAGWSRAEIAELSRVSETTIINLINGKVRRVSANSAALLRALPEHPADRAGRGWVPVTGTQRRGRALFRIGYTVGFMASELGIDPETMRRILNGGVRFVVGARARAMTRLYARVRWIPGPCLGNRIRGQERGWHGPLAWDDATIADPSAQPDVAEPYTPLAKNGRDSMRMAELEHLLGLGESESAIAKQMGASEAYIHDLAIAIRNRKKPTGYSAAA